MSEIARLRRQIEFECEAMRRLVNDFRATAAHDIIQHQYNVIGGVQERLAAIIGEQEATKITAEIYMQTIG